MKSVLELVWPRVQGMLGWAIETFRADPASATDNKGKPPSYATPAMAALMAECPRCYSGYATAVDVFVDVAKNAPEAALLFLLDWLPAPPD